MGRHALLEASDAPSDTAADAAAASDVRTVAEIIAQFRRDQGLTTLPSRPAVDEPVDAPATIPFTPDTLDVTAADDDAVQDEAAQRDDDDRDDDPSAGLGDPTDASRVDASPTDVRREAAWQAALRPAGTPPRPRRRRTGERSSASTVIASLTAELADTHPGLLDGSPHRRRAAAVARRTAPAGESASLRPVRVTGGLRGAALRVPALASGWRVPTRTPLVLAGVVAVSVVVTDQAGLLTSTQAGAAAAGEPAALTTTTVQADQAGQVSAADAAAAEAGAREARTRVSRLERAPIAAAAAGATPAGSSAVAATPPPDSVMKPGQTVPGDWVRPSAKGIYNSCFCARWGTMHEGIDFAAPLGSPILAVGDGVVVQAGPASGFGNWVIIKHANGDMTIYGHMKYYFVKIGQTVKAGQEIALVGAEGQSTGPHLHLGVKVGSTDGHDGTYVDPAPWLVARGIAVGTYNENG